MQVQDSSDQGTCTTKQTPVLQEKTRCGTALVVLLETYSEIFLGQLALNFDVPFKRLLWSVSYIFIKFAVGHVHCDIWGMRNNLRAWTEHSRNR